MKKELRRYFKIIFGVCIVLVVSFVIFYFKTGHAIIFKNPFVNQTGICFGTPYVYVNSFDIDKNTTLIYLSKLSIFRYSVGSARKADVFVFRKDNVLGSSFNISHYEGEFCPMRYCIIGVYTCEETENIVGAKDYMRLGYNWWR